MDGATTARVRLEAHELTSPRIITLTVANPEPGGGTSGTVELLVTLPPPVITTVTPAVLMAGDAGVTLRVVGQRFRPSSVMRWNGNDRPTRVISETEFEADLSAVDLLVAQRARLAVISPALEGGSAEVEFAVYNPTPVITGISPTRRGIGGASFTLTVTGAQFVPGAVVTWNGQPRPTTFTSAAQVTATIASSDLASGRAVPVAIRNP